MSAVILEVFNVPSDVDYGVDIVKRRPGADPSTSTVTRLWRKWLKLRGRGLPQAGRAADGSGQFGRWARGEVPRPLQLLQTHRQASLPAHLDRVAFSTRSDIQLEKPLLQLL